MAYYAIITDAGQTLLAEAMASGVPVTLTHFAVGDGGGQPMIPDPAMTALVGETYRDSISSLTTDPAQPDALVAQLIVPKESGGYTVREVGLFTEDGTLFSVANYPDQVKPPVDSGYAIKLDLRYVLAVSDTSAITIVIPPGDYLTKEAADALYLDTALNLGEIADAGEEAQQAARDNIDAAPAAHTHIPDDIIGLMDFLKPVGTIHISSKPENPATYFGVGVWVARPGLLAGAGECIDGVGKADTYTVGYNPGRWRVNNSMIVAQTLNLDVGYAADSGWHEHPLTANTDWSPDHTHAQLVTYTNTGSRIEQSGGEATYYVGEQATGPGGTHAHVVSGVAVGAGTHGHIVTGTVTFGSGDAINGQSFFNPYYGAYVWERTE